jgi:hypothetical protein
MSSKIPRITSETKCAKDGCGAAATGAARASEALGIAHCGLPDHVAWAVRERDARLAASGAYLVQSFATAPLRSTRRRIYRNLCALTAGRPAIAVRHLNGQVSTDWAFLDLRLPDETNPYVRYPKIVFRPTPDPDLAGPSTWQLLASRMNRQWYRYFPIDWCLDASMSHTLNPSARVVRLTRQILADLGRL